MIFDLDQRTAEFSVGEFAGFSLGPRESGQGGAAGIWRAQLGTQWHNELRQRSTAEHADAAHFEVPINGRVVHRGWTLSLAGRIDQIIRSPDDVLATEDPTSLPAPRERRARRTLLREIKSVTRSLPADQVELRRDYPEYFVQLATYLSLARNGLSSPADSRLSGSFGPGNVLAGELVFVETGSGVVQTVEFTPTDEGQFRAQLDQVVEFLELRWRARERLRHLRFRPAFATPRPGQETTLAELTTVFERQPLVLFEAPTGFGKTGVLLEFALGQLRSGHFDRALYLTSKSTGQLQVVRTLGAMTAPDRTRTGGLAPASTDSAAGPGATPVAVWHVRNKAEHCVNATFHCIRDNCTYLDDASSRWASSGLAQFYLDEHHVRDLDALREAGRHARICPYEITRTALAFNDVWIGDYNYVFAPRNRGLFFDQPGFVPARTLLLIDEAHNLPSRVADAFSAQFSAWDALTVREDLHRVRPPASFLTAWEHWCHFLQQLRANEGLPAHDEDDAHHLLAEIGKQLALTSLDYAALGPRAAEALWEIPSLLEDLKRSGLPRLWWSPRDSELQLTCLDAATAIGSTLREFGGVVLASATLTPVEGFSESCGLAAPPEVAAAQVAPPERLGKLTKRDTKKLYRQLTSAAELLRVEEARDAASPAHLHAHAPWREGTYDVAIDARVDTTFQHRTHHLPTTADTIVAVHADTTRTNRTGSAPSAIAVFFPSYAYAESLRQSLATRHPAFRVAVQPKVRDLAAQGAWVDESLFAADALFLVLGSSFAESIDVLGGRVTHAMIVGPALPEVNAVQRARIAEATRQGATRDAAFRQVYQIPGMTKVNQALGRLVRAPGHRARVLLHCRRFREPSYLSLLAPEYRGASVLRDSDDLTTWLAGSAVQALRPAG